MLHSHYDLTSGLYQRFLFSWNDCTLDAIVDVLAWTHSDTEDIKIKHEPS